MMDKLAEKNFHEPQPPESNPNHEQDADCITPPVVKVETTKEIEDLYRAQNVILTRNKILKCAIQNLDQSINPKGKDTSLELQPEELFFLASTDLFVEKAQLALTQRGELLIWAGIGSVIMAILLLTFGFWAAFLPNNIISSVLSYWKIPVDEFPKDATTKLGLYIFKAIASSAYIYVSVKIFISLARSFFNEGLSLFERRHALRFGRLYLYLKRGKVSEKWLTEFFQWNKETKTSFLDMKPEVLTETLLHKLVGVFSDLGKLPPEIWKAVSKK